MRVPLRWLAELVELPASVDLLAERLTVAGLTVDSYERIGPDLSGVRVGLVRECGRHPDADKLSVCKVDVGEGEPVLVVCGAPNVAVGQKVAVVLPGAVLPDGTKIKKTKLRGVVSNGMICSERELGLGEAAQGILVLDAGARVGAPLSEVIAVGDVLFDCEITPNRGDWVSLLGVAREVRALFGGALRLPPCAPREAGRPAAESIRISIEDRRGCRRYVGRVVRGVRVGPSPDWLRARLEVCGVRSKSNVVDVTNLVMLELGQPLHAFDLAKLAGAEVRVRAAGPGEKLRTLDGETRALEPSDLVIADAARATALAGVMGGADSEVTDATRDVLLEAAEFDPARVRRTARRLGLHSESSYRFERGVDPAGVLRAADRAALLLAELAGGEVAPGAVEALGEEPARTRSVSLDPAHTNRLLGTQLSEAEMCDCLARLGIEPVREGGRLVCAVPSWRNDLERPQDLIEEIARVWGYERIPTTFPVAPLVSARVGALRAFDDAARDAACAAGLVEVMSFPALAPDELEALRLAPDDPRRRCLRLQNPVSEREGALWTTLVPGLLALARQNLARRIDRVRVFQVANVFRPLEDGKLPEETLWLGALVTRGDGPTLWERRPPPPLFFEAKGIALRVLDELEIEPRVVAGGEPYLHPGASAEIRVGERRVGVVGELHPAVASAFEITAPCALLELDLTALCASPRRARAYRDVSRQPSVRRDIAVVFDRSMAAADALESIRRSAGRELISAELFDRYEGKGIPAGKVSLAFRLVFQRADRTLLDAEVSKLVDRVVEALRTRLGGELR